MSARAVRVRGPQVSFLGVRREFKTDAFSSAVNWTYWEREFFEFFPCGVRVLYHVADDAPW